VAIIKDTVKNEVRVIFIDTPRLIEGDSIDNCSREIIAIIDKCEEKCAVLHFGQVTFMSSSALGMVLKVNKKCKEFKVDLKLCNISADIKQVFKITGLDKVFSMYDDLDAAIKAFTKSGNSFFRTKTAQTYHVSRDG
jgi:anti-sigma B factor antagonist